MSGTVAQRLAGAAFWSYAGTIIERLVRFVVFMLIARAVTPAQFGLVTLVALVLGVFQDFLDTGVGQALVRQNDPDERTYDSAFWLVVVYGAVTSVATFAVGWGLAGWLRPAGLAAVLQAMAPWPLLMAMGSIHTARLVRELGFKALSLRLMLASIVSGVVGVALARDGWGVQALVVRSLIYAALHTGALWLLSGWRPRWRFGWRWLRPLRGDGTRLLGSSLLGQLNSRGYDLAAGTVLGAAAIGSFRVAGQIVSMLVDLTAGPITGVAFSALARERDDPVRSRETFVFLAQVSALLVFPAFVGLGLLGDLFVPLLVGNQWHEAVAIMPLLTLLAVPIHFQIMLLAALFAAGRTDRMLHWQVAQCVTTLLTIGFGIPFGLVGVAVAAVVHLYMLIPLGCVWMRRDTAIAPGLLARVVAPVLAAAVVMGAVIALMRAALPAAMPSAEQVAVLVAVGLACMAAALPLIAPELTGRLPGAWHRALRRWRPAGLAGDADA